MTFHRLICVIQRRIPLRSSPFYRHSDDLAPYDECTSNTAESMCNVQFYDTGWKQAKLPVSFGGFGLRSANDLALQAYMSSREYCRRLASTILPPPYEPSVENVDDVITTCTSSGLKIPDDPVSRSNWDSLLCSAHAAALKPILRHQGLACFVAATCRKSGAWLSCLPSAAIGCRLDNDSFRLAVSIRLGLRACTPHLCRCGSHHTSSLPMRLTSHLISADAAHITPHLCRCGSHHTSSLPMRLTSHIISANAAHITPHL